MKASQRAHGFWLLLLWLLPPDGVLKLHQVVCWFVFLPRCVCADATLASLFHSERAWAVSAGSSFCFCDVATWRWGMVTMDINEMDAMKTDVVVDGFTIRFRSGNFFT
jgi:hypothetical protein